jgi:hypothetical protein
MRPGGRRVAPAAEAAPGPERNRGYWQTLMHYYTYVHETI